MNSSTPSTAEAAADSQERSYFSRLSVVFADPIRLKIVSELFLREMSPSQFLQSYGGGSVRHVDRHFKRLQEVGWLRWVRRESSSGRRGAPQNFYRAPKLAVFDNATWAELPNTVRAEFSWRIFEQFAERVKAALEAGTFDSQPNRHFTWTPLVLDETGRREVIRATDRLFAALFEEQADARVRLAHSGEKPMHATVGLAAFDSPRLKRNRSGLLLPPPTAGVSVSDDEFTVRLSRVFRNETKLKIVTELTLREMSPSEFAQLLGTDDISEMSRLFRSLCNEGWLDKVSEKTGGSRRGATETFYRAVEPAIFDTRSWAQVQNSVRNSYSWRIFEQLAEQVREAMDSGTFDSRADRHHTWTQFVLDGRGWEQVIAAVDGLFHRILQEQKDAKRRLAGNEEEPVIATVYLAAFESPEPA